MPGNFDDAAAGVKHDPALALSPDEKHLESPVNHRTELVPVFEGKGTISAAYDSEDFPTKEELLTLRRIPDKIPWSAYTVAFVELCERFSYYGTTVVCMHFSVMAP